MKLKPRKCTVRGVRKWYVDAIDPLTQKRARKFFPTETAAEAYQGDINKRPAPTRTAPVLDADATLDAFAANWLAYLMLGGRARRNTILRYRGLLANQICNFALSPTQTLGQVKVRTLHAGHITACIGGLRAAGYHRRTVRTVLRLLALLCDRAVHRGLLLTSPITNELRRVDLNDLVSLPKTHVVKAFTESDAAHFLGVAAEHSRFSDLYTCGFLTGCRLGELLGLQLSDDLVLDGHRVLHVQRTLYRGSVDHPVTGPPKGGKARHVDVSAALAPVLDRVKASRSRVALKHGWGRVPWTFVTPSKGTVIDQAHVNRDFQRILDLAGLSHLKLSPHAMRHTFACSHAARGCSPLWLQQQLGHSDVRLTLNVYASSFALHDAGAADALGARLLGNRLGNRTGA
jgi:integrase